MDINWYDGTKLIKLCFDVLENKLKITSSDWPPDAPDRKNLRALS
ncbi:hypothetical protein D1BOALGB6SA_6984 [Olavius sp. associated proteobacterium Delta 1]|nr:hypothetical protein D1BOALGB6SA_6984 [Olavius sp. associated proteobacterium Delta 1]